MPGPVEVAQAVVPVAATSPIAPDPAGMPWQGWLLIGLAALGGAERILAGVRALLGVIAPRTKTTADDHALDVLGRLDDAAIEILARLRGLAPGLASPTATASREASDFTRQDAVNALLDAIAIPAGRDVEKAWDRACLLYGRSNYQLPVSLGGDAATSSQTTSARAPVGVAIGNRVHVGVAVGVRVHVGVDRACLGGAVDQVRKLEHACGQGYWHAAMPASRCHGHPELRGSVGLAAGGAAEHRAAQGSDELVNRVHVGVA